MEHKTKYKQLTEAYLHALGVITESTATWAEFLCSAAYTYEERFQSQVLLHHQRPGVKAVATLNQWDREKNRHIVRGTHGIPVFDAKHPECLTYVFDYQDTAGRSTPGLFPWTVYESKSGIARHNLLRRSGEKSLDSYVHTKVQQIVDTEVKSETSAAMRAELQKFLEQSAKYVVYTRLNMPVDNLDTSAFSFATQYQNRPKVLERLGTLLSHSLVACLSPVRDIAQAMHMTMPPPEGLAVQKKDTRTRSVPETSEVTAEASPEAPREWGFYVIPDLKTWATNSSERTPIEHYETFEEARDRFAALRDQPYNKTNDLNDDGQPYAHLTLGLESKDKLSSVDILQVRAGQNYLVEDFTRMQRLRADSVVLENLSRVAREIGFDRVRPYVMENGSYKALPDMPFSQWENPYFTVDSPEQGDTFTIYQLKGGSETRDYRFEPYESLQEAGLAIDRQNYDLVYTAPLDGKTTLEDIFRTFNLDRPPDFTGHSLSVSDIVVLNRGGDTKAYYCDSAGFVDVPSFLEQKIETAVDQPIINEDEIRRALCDGSGFENGKMRIQYYFSQPVLPPREETIRWLKKEYGTGGRSWDFANGSRGWLDYNNKGFEIQCKTDNGRVSHTLTWQEVSSRLQALVQSDHYLSDEERPEYEEWLSDRQAEQAQKARDLEQAKEWIRDYCRTNNFDQPDFEDLRHIDLAYSSTGEGDHSINVYVDLLHHKIVYNVDGERILSAQYASTAELVEHELSGVTFDELIGTAEQEYQERKREQAIRSAPQKRPCIPGDIVYLENDKAFIVQDIGEGEILLQDQELPLFSRSVSKEEFSRLLERNERNSRLQAPATPSIETSEKTKESTAPEQVQPQPIPQKTAVEIPINGKWTKFQTVADAEQAAYEEYKANIARNAQNYKALPDEQTEPGGPKIRFQDNINALRLLQHLETTGMQATPEQQQLLARYVGWGGLADAFDARKDNWHKEYQELKELLPEAEYEAARASTLTSYYTSPEIVRAMYSTLERFGLQGGNILEPSMGVGAFFANRPASFDESANLFGVELDPVTGRIAKQLKEQDAKQRAVHYATAERYAKVIASAIIGNTGSVNSGDSSEYFNETARGLITGLVLLVSQYGQDGERHIVSVFNLIVELAGADNPEKGNTVQKSRLAAMLEGVTDRRIKGYISTTTSADIRTTLNIVSSALSKLLKFVDAELEQLICTHDNDLDAEQFIERPTAIFLIAPDENETRHFLASLFVRFLTDDLIALAERQGGHCPRPFYYFLDEFGNFPAIPGVTSLFSAIRSRGGRILVAVQSYSQFLLKYDKNVTEIIKDNCQILLNTFVSPSAQDTATSISKMLGDETILTGSSSRSDGKTTSSHQLMGRPLMSPAQMVRIQRDTWIVEKAGYAPMKTHLEGYWKYLSLAPQEQDSTGENDYLEIKLLSTESLRQALGSAPACPHTPPAATREPRRKLGASRREAAALYPGKFNP